jgi:hypothetical protein
MPKNTTMTPLPTADLVTLTTSVARIDQNVRSIKNDLIPPLSTDTREARDKAREALTKVNDHVADGDSHEHPCVEGARQERQDSELAKTRDLRGKYSTLYKIFWVTISIVAGALSGSYGYAFMISNQATANQTSNASQDKNLDRHEDTIAELRKAREQDRELFLRQQAEMPTRVVEAVKSARPTVEEIEENLEVVADETPELTEVEQRQIKQAIVVLKRAKKRGESKAVAYGR